MAFLRSILTTRTTAVAATAAIPAAAAIYSFSSSLFSSSSSLRRVSKNLSFGQLGFSLNPNYRIEESCPVKSFGHPHSAAVEMDQNPWSENVAVMPELMCMRKAVSLDSLLFDPEIEKTAKALRKARREELRNMAENRENNVNQPPHAAPIRDHFRPVLTTHYSGIARGTINANSFELKPALINMVQQNQFNGAATADPHMHLRTFLEITDTVKINNVSEDIIRLRLFPFSLRDQARSWLQSLPLGSITTWSDLATKFLAKYFPPAKSAQLKIEISTFRQNDFEQLYEAWERYKELLRRCPNHGFEDWVQIELFYNGLNGQTRGMVDAAAGGTIFAKSPDEAYDLLEQMTINSYQWPSERSGMKKPAGVYSVDPITSLTAQVSALTTQIAAMNKGGQMNAEVAVMATEEQPVLEDAQYINNRGFGGYRGNPPPNTYHPGLRNHENFSYANNKNVLNPPPGFNTQKGEGKSSFEDLVGTFVAESGKRMARTESRMDSMETHIGNMGATMKSLETQIGQLASALKDHNRGHFPSNTEVNPKEQCKVITLRSGKELIGEEIKAHETENVEEGISEKVEDRRSDNEQQPLPKADLPYPQRFRKKKMDEQFSKFLEIFKKIQINIPFIDALEQMPNYAKFLKDAVSQKRRLQEYETVKLTEECSAILQKKLPQKLKDPGSFTIPCVIGGSHVNRALCDLGASINLMPFSIYRDLELGEVKPTTITLQLADRSLTYPRGVVEDVLVKVDKFIFPADFVILDMEEDQDAPLIFGRPFLATGRALIDVHKGELTLRVGGEAVIFNIYNAIRGSNDVSTCNSIDIVDSCLSHVSAGEILVRDHLERCLLGYTAEIEEEEDLEVREQLLALDNSPKEKDVRVQREELGEREFKEVSLTTSELKELPDHLCYAFLGENSTYPVIISSSLTSSEKDKLLRVLREFRTAIGWSISDIRGISPTICMHKILMEETYTPYVDHQRRLNPAMKEVVKNEVLKLLNAGVIYAISDSSWVSPVQVVPKKGGITVVKNEHDELISTRPVTGWRVCIDYRKLNKATRKDHFPLPFIDQMLDRLAGYHHYCFLDGYSGYNQIAIAPEDQEKTTFTCPYGTFAFRRMPFGLCNAPATFQRCMMAIFADMVEEIMEVFMDDFSVFGTSFDHCLHNLSLVLQRCQEKNLVLNWEKCHFMIQEGIVLGHKVSSRGLEVDRAKIVAIEKLPPPKNIKGIRSFLGHAGFYRRFIKDFSKISKPLCNLLEKDSTFIFDDDCLQAFQKLTDALISAPIMVVPDWKESFELMCDASDYAVGAVLGQRREKVFRAIYYASRTMDPAQQNYTTTEKEMFAVVFAFDKFRPYLIGTKVVVYTDHAAIRYLFAKKDAKPRLIRWILLLQEFDFEIKDKKGSENQVADHLSRLELGDKKMEGIITESFPDEQLFEVSSKLPWFADIANFLSCGVLPPDLNLHQRKKFLHDIKFYLWDDPYVFKRCADQIIRRCVTEGEAQEILEECHSAPYGGHFGASRTAAKTEFMVDMSCEGCVKSVKAKLQTVDGVKNIDVDLTNQVVRVLATSPVKILTEALEQTGRKARLIGQGTPEDFLVSAAVAEFKGPVIFGVVRLAQVNIELAKIEATFSGLAPGKHGWSINQFGDLTMGAASTGKVFNLTNYDIEPLGDLGTVDVDDKGEAFFSGVKEKLRVADLIGRSIAVYESEDRSDDGLAAAVLARSAGVGENYKKLCTCDGTTIWEATNADFVRSKV